MTAQPQTGEATWTVARLLAWTRDYLTRHGLDDARLAGEVLLSRAMGCRRIDLYARHEASPSTEQLERFREWVKRAAACEPIAYIVGEKEFFSLAFEVSGAVLIPRPETEALVECVLDHCMQRGWTDPVILDCGTGSGCIAITLLKQLPKGRAVGTDLSQAALAIAQQNAARHGVSDRFVPVNADGLAIPAALLPEDGVHVLACNPPYIPASAIAGLQPGVRDFEPRTALTDESDGLSFYRMLAADSSRILRDGGDGAAPGVVAVEVGDDRAAEVREIIERQGLLVYRRTQRDRVTGRERVLLFEKA